jgi:hypothetical protein
VPSCQGESAARVRRRYARASRLRAVFSCANRCKTAKRSEDYYERMRIPWLVVGTLIGILGGLFFMPSPDPSKTMAEQNIPPIAGACLGAFLGAIAEVAVRRIDTCSPIRLPSLLRRQHVICDTTFGTRTMLVAVALAAIACAYPDWFVSIAFCTIIFSLYFAACARVGKNRRRPG